MSAGTLPRTFNIQMRHHHFGGDSSVAGIGKNHMAQGNNSFSAGRHPAREMLTSGETPQLRRQRDVAEEKLRAERSAEFRKMPPRLAWWLFVGTVAALWFFEITSFTWWWTTGGMIVGILFGLVLAPFFPLIALFEGEFGRAIVGAVLLGCAVFTFVRARPETEGLVLFLRRYLRR